MNNFKSRKPSGNRPPNRRGFSAPARPRFGDERRQEVVQKFDAVCSACGKACQVPFRPNGKKPVYCKDCFDTPRHGTTNNKSFSSNESSGGKSIADLTRQIAAMNEKIDAMLEILEGLGGE